MNIKLLVDLWFVAFGWLFLVCYVFGFWWFCLGNLSCGFWAWLFVAALCLGWFFGLAFKSGSEQS